MLLNLVVKVLANVHYVNSIVEKIDYSKEFIYFDI